MEYIGIKKIRSTGKKKQYSIQNNEHTLLWNTPNFLVEDGLVSKNSKHACVHKNMKVLTNKGYKKISKIVKSDKIGYLDSEGLLKLTKRYEVITTGRKHLYKIKTEKGLELKITLDHEFFVETDEGIIKKQLREIKVGDKVLMI